MFNISKWGARALEARKYKKLAEDLAKALDAAVTHLDYCGYGDNWERECAHAAELPSKLEAALGRAKEARLI